MRIRILAALIALGAFAAIAPAAQAYRLGGKRWPSKTITYYNGTPYKAEVRAAVQTWNASGARIHFVAASRTRARVQIKSGGKPLCFGYAQIGYWAGHRAKVLLGRGCQYSSGMTGIAAHELGHILGLLHEDRGCAAMNTHLAAHCGPQPDWTYHCRYLEQDDVVGAIKRYGGQLKPVRPDAFCPEFAPPQPAAGLTLALVGRAVDATATVAAPQRLVNDAGTVIWAQLYLWRYPNACPPDAGAGDPQVRLNAVYGAQTVRIDNGPPRGTWCYAMVVADGSGRRTPPVAATVVVP